MTTELERVEAAENLALGLANDPRSATPLEASLAKMALTTMVAHRDDGIPTQYVHGAEVAAHAYTMWRALLTALRPSAAPIGDEAGLQTALEPFIKAAELIVKRRDDYADRRVAAFGGLADAHALYPRDFVRLLAAASSEAPK